MNKLLKLTAVLLCAATALSSGLLISCSAPENDGGTEAKTETTTAASDASDSESTRLSDNVPDADYGGDTFTFLTRPDDANGYWGTFEFYAEEQTGAALNDAIYDRNAKLAERFNVVFEEVCVSTWTSSLTNSVAAGTDEYDLVPLIVQSAASYAANGSLLEYSALEYVDLSQPWWDAALNPDFTIANKQYFAVGDLTLIDKEATYITMFNKDVATDFGVGDLYALVREGKWTVDKMMEISATVTSDLDGDSKITYKDRVGTVSDDGATYRAMYYACGAGFFDKDGDDMPYFSIDMDRATAAIEKIAQLTSSEDVILAEALYNAGVSNPWSDEGINGMFKEGRALFYGISLTVMSKMRDMDSDFGVLPYPKLYESDADYTSFIGSWLADTICVPVTCSDPQRTSAIIEALCCESKYGTLPAYYDVTVTNKTMRDEESAEMLDYVFEHRTMDLSQIYDWGGLGGMLTSAKAETFASVLAKLEKTINRTMEKTLEAFSD